MPPTCPTCCLMSSASVGCLASSKHVTASHTHTHIHASHCKLLNNTRIQWLHQHVCNRSVTLTSKYAQIVCVRSPETRCCALGALLVSSQPFTTSKSRVQRCYATAITETWARLPMGSLVDQDRIIPMPHPPPLEYIVEPYLFPYTLRPPPQPLPTSTSAPCGQEFTTHLIQTATFTTFLERVWFSLPAK